MAFDTHTCIQGFVKKAEKITTYYGDFAGCSGMCTYAPTLLEVTDHSFIY